MSNSSGLQNRRLLLADDDTALQHSVVTRLEREGMVVEMCLNGAELQRLLATRAAAFDVVVTDLWDMGSSEARFIPERDIPALVQAYAPLPFIIFSSEAYQAQQYEEAGARGYVLKIDTVQGLLQALRALFVRNQPMFYSASIELAYRISRRERQVLAFAAEGLTAEEIAERLVVTVATVEAHKARIFAKLRTDENEPMNIVKAVAIAVREGLIR
jgi:DNA-binding NarL/FixJ family response regulator